MRVRSLWASTTLSNGGRKRGGAGVSGSGNGLYVEQLPAVVGLERAQVSE